MVVAVATMMYLSGRKMPSENAGHHPLDGDEPQWHAQAAEGAIVSTRGRKLAPTAEDNQKLSSSAAALL